MDGTETVQMSSGIVYRMGCKLPPESRFAAVPTWAEANPVLPESQWEEHDDYAKLAPPVKRQDFNNCTNAALAGAAELLTAASGGERVTLSQVFLYWLTNGGQDQGAFCRDLAAKFLDTGICRDDLCPQSAGVGRPSAAAFEDAKSRQALEVYQCMNWQDVGSALTRRFVVYHGFLLGSAFFRTGANGVVPSYDGSYANGHAMYSRGLVLVNGVWRTITPNSWGGTFGAGGVGYIDSSYFWHQRGNFVNLDCFAVRALRASTDGVPAPKM